jgi:membrane protein implicated in regulation of membrane protease activity
MDTKAGLVALVTAVMAGLLVTIVSAELLAWTIWLSLIIAVPLGLFSLVLVFVGTYRYLNVSPAPRQLDEYEFNDERL